MSDFNNFSNISKTFSQIFRPNELFSAMEVVAESLKVDQYCLMLWDDDQKILENRLICCPFYKNEKAINFSLKIGEGLSGIAFQAGEPVLIQNESKKLDYKLHKGCSCTQNSPLLSLPLSCNKIIGVWNIHKTKKNNFTKEDIEILSVVAEHIAIAVNRLKKLELTNNLSIKDDLTQLLNERYFVEYLEKEVAQCRRYTRIFSLIMIDIDNLRNCNDINGNSDAALKQIAKIIKNYTRKGDLAVHLGGDKFILLLPEVNASFAFAVVERFRKRIAETPFIRIENLIEGQLSVTSGTATYPEDGHNAKTLIKSAVRKMYS